MIEHLDAFAIGVLTALVTFMVCFGVGAAYMWWLEKIFSGRNKKES